MPIVFVLRLFLRCDLREEHKEEKGKKDTRGEKKITMRVEWTNKIIVVRIGKITRE